MRIKTCTGGFTLIEIMIVVALIAIMASIVIPNFSESLQKSRDANTMENLGSMRSALTMYYADNNAYPATVDALYLGRKYLSAPPTTKTAAHDSSTVVQVQP